MSPLTDGTRRDSTKSSSRHCRYLYHLHVAPGMVRCGLSGKEGCSRLRKQLGGPGARYWSAAMAIPALGHLVHINERNTRSYEQSAG